MAQNALSKAEIIEQTKAFIGTRFLGGEVADLTSSTQLLRTGIIDSVSMVELIQFLQTHFGVSIPASEIRAENVETLDAIAQLVARYM